MSRDRRAGVALFVVAALALGVTTALTDSVLPPLRHDETAYAELVALFDENEAGTWIVEYEVERTIAAGETTKGVSTEARAEDTHIVRAGGSANATIGDTRYVCTVAEDDGTLCQTAPATDTLSSSEIVRTAVDAGAYLVTHLPSETIAGEAARCYRLFASGGYLPALGVETQYCFAADGVELRTKITTVNDERSRRATRVQREPSTSELQQVLGELEAEAGSADEGDSN